MFESTKPVILISIRVRGRKLLSLSRSGSATGSVILLYECVNKIYLCVNVGKGESIWDQVSHRDPNIIADGSTGDDAAKSYDFYKDDVKALKDIGVRYSNFFKSMIYS